MAKKRQHTRQTLDIPKDATSDIDFVQGTNYLLAVAIDEYKHIRPLYNCVRDAEKIVETLTTKYTFSPDHVTKLYNEKATAGNILIALDRYATHLEEHDSLVLLFSGHGQNRKEIGFWIPFDAADFTGYLPLSTVRDFLEPIKARHIFVISDSCFSGKLFSGNRSVNENPLESRPSRFALTAGRNEPVLDGTLGKNSPFALAFLSILEENKEDLGAQELSMKVQKMFERKPKGQQPLSAPLSIDWNGKNLELAETGQFYFKLKNDAEAEEHVQIGRLLMVAAKEVADQGLYRSAAKHLEHAKNKSEDPGEIPYLLGMAYQGAGDHEKAMKAFEELMQNNHKFLPPKHER